MLLPATGKWQIAASKQLPGALAHACEACEVPDSYGEVGSSVGISGMSAEPVLPCKLRRRFLASSRLPVLASSSSGSCELAACRSI